jgi:GntR family transcriptional regulator
MKTAVEVGVAQYVQLASVLRHQIAQGELAAGQRLPTVAELAAAHGVARITVRQAYGVLAREGLLTSARGRGTFVADAPPQRGAGLDAHLRAAINDPATAELRIELIEQKRQVALPADLLGPFKPCAGYDVVKKRHIHQGEPFCLIEMFVDSEIRARFPRGAEKRHKIAWLINQHAPGRLHEVQQTLSVAPADLPLSRELDCAFTTPVLHMTRRVLDTQGRVALAGRFWYRGDRFVMDQSIPFDVWLHHPGMVIPDYHRGP